MAGSDLGFAHMGGWTVRDARSTLPSDRSGVTHLSSMNEGPSGQGSVDVDTAGISGKQAIGPSGSGTYTADFASAQSERAIPTVNGKNCKDFPRASRNLERCFYLPEGSLQAFKIPSSGENHVEVILLGENGKKLIRETQIVNGKKTEGHQKLVNLLNTIKSSFEDPDSMRLEALSLNEA